MNGFKASAALGAVLACFALNAMAQAPAPTTDPKKAPESADAKKAEPKKATQAKKAPPKKTAKKAPPKKPVDTKAQATGQGGTVQKYEAGKAPDLKDAK